MRKFLLVFPLLAIAAFVPTPAQAQYCEGTVHGLSSTYNSATGAGFLAVRSKPRASSHKRGEIFNGDKVEIFDLSGNWYKVATVDGVPVLEGWAHVRWISNDCGY